MPDREYVYTVRVNAAQAAAQASRIRAIFQRELSQIRVNPTVQTQRAPSLAGGGAVPFGSSRIAGNELLPGFGNLTNLAGYTIAGTAITQLGRMTADTTIALTEQGTALRRADFTAKELAGSTERLSSLMRVYQQATGDAQTGGESLAKLNQLMAIGFADTEQELRRFVTASRGAAMATGQDLAYIQSQLQLTIANQSTMRLDQIGLGVEEVQNRIALLKNTMPELSTEARYQEAVLGLLNEKYGSLVTSVEAGASGLELLRTQFRDLREEMARNVEQRTNSIFESWAVGMGSENTQAQIRQLQRMAETSRAPIINRLSGGRAGEQAAAFERMADLLNKVDEAARNGEPSMEALRAKVQELATEMNTTGAATDANIVLLGELERTFRLTANGGIVYSDALDAASASARRLAASQEIVNSTFEEAQRLFHTSLSGQMWFNPGPGLAGQMVTPLGPQLPSAEWLRQNQIVQSGGFLTPGGANLSDVRANWLNTWAAQNEQADRDRKREAEQAAQRAIREGERVARETEQAWRQAADATEQAFRRAASELEGQIRQIPGLFGRSEVTKEQEELGKLGVPQNFADNYLRRLTDEVLNGVNWEGVDLADAARRAGIDQSLNPKAQLAIFSQKWADQSLFANAANLDLFDQEAIRAEMERQRQSRLGQQNILSMFGLGEDDQGAYFTGLGGTIRDGMMAGAQEGLADFGRQAIQDVMAQLRSDTAMQEYAQLGALQFDAMAAGWLEAADNSNLVGAFTARIMAQLSETMENQ